MQMVDMTDRSHYSLSCQGGYMNTHFANTVKSPFKIQLLCILSCFLKEFNRFGYSDAQRLQSLDLSATKFTSKLSHFPCGTCSQEDRV